MVRAPSCERSSAPGRLVVPIYRVGSARSLQFTLAERLSRAATSYRRRQHRGWRYRQNAAGDLAGEPPRRVRIQAWNRCARLPGQGEVVAATGARRQRSGCGRGRGDCDCQAHRFTGRGRAESG